MRRPPPVRHLLWLALVAVLLPLSPGWASEAWTYLFAASFTDVPDGPGDGITFPSNVGRLETVTESGDPFPEVSPSSGILDERLVLTDRNGRKQEGFGVFASTGNDTVRTTKLAFDVTLLKATTTFLAEVTDTTGVDISILIRRDGISVNGNPLGTSARILVPYIVVIQMFPSGLGVDVFVVTVREAETGRLVGEWSGPIPGGMDPVTGLLLWKSGASPGAVALDDISIVQREDEGED